jgi:hypothetical protein
MALDLNAIRSKLDKLQNKNTRQNMLWKPSPGQQTVRILPYKENPSNPFIELYFHFDFGGKNFVSPMSFGEDDPIYEFAMNLRKSGDRDSYIQSKKFEPKMRTYVPVLVRGEEGDGIKYWSFGKQVYEQLLGYIADPDYGDITHPETGRDVVIDFEKPDNGYPKTTIRVKPNQTKALDDAGKLKSMIQNQPIITELYNPLSYSELETELQRYLNGESSDTQQVEESYQPQPVQKKEEPKSSPILETSEVESAFDDLFNS